MTFQILVCDVSIGEFSAGVASLHNLPLSIWANVICHFCDVPGYTAPMALGPVAPGHLTLSDYALYGRSGEV